MKNIEYEAKFININKDKIREQLKNAGGQLVKAEFLQKRVAFNLPAGHEIQGGWIRIRDEADKVTMSLKVVSGDKIEDQSEILLNIDNFKEAEKFLTTLGCKRKSYIENKRELWELGGAEVTIDEWPFIEPFVEIESSSEEKVKAVAEKLGFDYAQALFGATDVISQKKYGLPLDVINSIPELSFNMENPYLKVDKSKF